MRREFILKEKSGRRTIAFPVSPAEFSVSMGQTVQTVHLHEIGDVALAGKPRLGSISLHLLLPKQSYSFSTADRDPYDYVQQLERWACSGKQLRFVITGTPVNRLVMVESVDYGENDGTGDVYLNLVLRETVELEEVTTLRPSGTGEPRPTPSPTSQARSHTVEKGDCMSSIALKYYSNGGKAYYEALAAANNRSAYAYIYPGDVLEIPPKEQLGVK